MHERLYLAYRLKSRPSAGSQVKLISDVEACTIESLEIYSYCRVNATRLLGSTVKNQLESAPVEAK